jgi:hypothetical protein
VRRASLEDSLSALWPESFTFLVIATPTNRGIVDRLARDVHSRLRQMGATTLGDELDIEQLRARLRELHQAAITGMWHIRAYAGAPSPTLAQSLAGLVCATSDLEFTPYVLHPGEPVVSTARTPFAALLDAADADDVALVSDWRSSGNPEPVTGQCPFLGSTEMLAALARPPTCEIPGIRLAPQPTFDVTPEGQNAEGVCLGDILDAQLSRVGTMSVSLQTLNRHVFVSGATGSGKSQTVRALLEGISQIGIPWLVIEPSKREYADGMAGRLGPGKVLLVRPGDPELVPVSLNPLEPAPGFPLQSHLDMVRSLFLAAFEAEAPFPQVLTQALIRCYERRGWNLALGCARHEWFPPSQQRPAYPTLGDLQQACREVVKAIGYSQEIQDNVRGYVEVRIGSLRLGSPGRFFEGGHPLDFAALLPGHDGQKGQNVVLEMENLTNDQDKAFLIGVVLVRLVEHLQVEHRKQREHRRSTGAPETERLRHVTVVEEAHRLLKNVPPDRTTAAHAIEVFASLLAEIRAYGEGIVVAEQIPSKIFPDVLKNTALKIVHRLPAADDRFAVGATMNLTEEQSDYVVTLRPGIAATFADGMDRPLLMATPLGEHRENGKAEDIPPLVGRRSASCCGACQTEPCSLKQMDDAAQVAQAHPRLSLLVEFSVLAHVMGAGKFGLREDGWLRLLWRLDPRTVECAVAGLAQAAIDARYQYLVEFYSPDELAKHVADSVTCLLYRRREIDRCTPVEIEWRAGTWRFNDVLGMLQKTDASDSELEELTQLYRDTLGLDLGGGTRQEQLENIQAHPWSDYRFRHQLLWGDGAPSHLAQAARLPESTDRQREALEKALHFVVSIAKPWLLKHLFAA